MCVCVYVLTSAVTVVVVELRNPTTFLILCENVQLQIIQMMQKVYADACETDSLKQNGEKKLKNERNRKVNGISVDRNVYEFDD